MTFTPGQIAALRKLRELWPDTRFVLVGASALGCFLDFRWRATNDLDISVSIELDELPAGLDRPPGWSADPRAEHRWLAPEDVKVDILPAGPNLRRAGTLRWPRSGNEMSLLGQRLEFEHARRAGGFGLQHPSCARTGRLCARDGRLSRPAAGADTRPRGPGAHLRRVRPSRGPAPVH